MNPPFETSLKAAPWLRTNASKRLLKALSVEGHPVRFVGGCVRDGLLGHLDPSGDLDLATPALPHDVAAFLRQAGIKVIPTGLQHGTVTAIANGQSFEITTLREDIACDGRHATVQFTDNFVADAARRDFTINAMSVDQDGKLYDYFDGRDDLKAGRLRFVGDAERRVREDYLRILRFFRFFASFGKRPADRDALAACRNNADRLHDLSGERIRSEMLKLLRANDPIDALKLMAETGVTSNILPALPKLDILGKLLALSKKNNPILRLAALVRTLPEPIRKAAAIAERWRFSNAEALRLEKLASEPKLNPSATTKRARRDLYRLGSDTFLDLFYLSAAETGVKAENLENAKGLAASWETPVLPLSGKDLLDQGLIPGPAFGDLLGQIKAWWIDHDMQPDREACLQELKRLLAENRP